MEIIAVLMLLINQQHAPSTILVGKTFLWNVYCDPNKEIPVIEIGGIKYGLHDSLLIKKVDGLGNVIYSSNNGILYKKNNEFHYKNALLKIEMPLRSTPYSERIDAQRKNIYAINAYNEVHKLKSNINTTYVFNWNVDSDYMYYKNNTGICQTI